MWVNASRVTDAGTVIEYRPSWSVMAEKAESPTADTLTPASGSFVCAWVIFPVMVFAAPARPEGTGRQAEAYRLFSYNKQLVYSN